MEQERASNGDALALAAAKLERRVRENLPRQVDLRKSIAGCPAAFRGGDAALLNEERLGENILDAEGGIQRGGGILKHDCEIAKQRKARGAA